MNRSDLVDQLLTRYPHTGRKTVDKTVKSIFTFISNRIAAGNKVEVRGFACFSLKQRNASIVRNPRSGDLISIKSQNVIYFKAGKELKDRVNN